uniref:FBA domain-containing protein n=1 Tax=Podarcis muralis TaxID=64176 RepID=A0A670JGD5_PODMU
MLYYFTVVSRSEPGFGWGGWDINKFYYYYLLSRFNAFSSSPVYFTGVNISEPAPLLTLPRAAWNPLDPKGIFKGWQVSIEPLESDKAEVAPKSVLPRYSWCVKQQHIDLVAEGFWEELLDSYQPNFTVMDWYENSKLANSVYELHVRLLGADRATVLGEFHHVAHEGEQDRQENKNWHHVRAGLGGQVGFEHKTHTTPTFSSNWCSGALL